MPFEPDVNQLSRMRFQKDLLLGRTFEMIGVDLLGPASPSVPEGMCQLRGRHHARELLWTHTLQVGLGTYELHQYGLLV